MPTSISCCRILAYLFDLDPRIEKLVYGSSNCRYDSHAGSDGDCRDRGRKRFQFYCLDLTGHSFAEMLNQMIDKPEFFGESF